MFFSARAIASAEVLPYEELIPDYFSFYAPTRVAACGDLLAVFDEREEGEGRIVLFKEGARVVFSAGTDSCDKLCVSENGIYLLTGLKKKNPKILSFSLEGVKRETSVSSENAMDILLFGSDIFVLSEMKTVTRYSSEEVAISSFDLPSVWEYSKSFAYDGEEFYFLSAIDKEVFKKDHYEEEERMAIDISGTHILASEGTLYYGNEEGDLCAFGTGAFPFRLTEKRTGDAYYRSLTDFAVSNGKAYIADCESQNVKAYDLETGAFIKMIGSYGNDLGRLKAPVALAAKDGKIVVADDARVTVFTEDGADALKGRSISHPTDVAFAGESIYLADDGVLYEYNAGFVVKDDDYPLGNGTCRFVTSAPNGAIYASAGRAVYRKREGEKDFSLFLTAEEEIDGLNVGIGGKLIYLMAGGKICAYSQEGTKLSSLTVSPSARNFAVDYRGNVFLLSDQGKILKYARNLEGYAAPLSFDLAEGYASFVDFAIDGEGRFYVAADHNVLVYSKTAFGAFIAEDSDFKDEEESVSPRFVCEVTKEYTISYIAPDNFEDITPIPHGTRLMCYATVKYGEDEYLRVETEKGTTYIPKSDAKVFEQGAAPLSKARCLIPAIGSVLVGVNLYAEPSHLAVRAQVEPLFAALGKEDVFDVISYVAAEDGRDVWGFYRVVYQGKTAYVLVEDVVSVDDDPEPMPPLYPARVKSESLGKTVPLYKEASRESETVAYLTDGTEITLLEPIDENKEFLSVLYDGEIRYVLTANLGQGGLSSGQILAIVLSVAALVGSALTILILRANKKHRRHYGYKE